MTASYREDRLDIRSRTLKFRIAIIATFLLIAGLGCLCLPGGIIPAIPLNVPTSPTQPPVTQTPGINTSGLNAKGPWLLMESDKGLWAANPDGSGMAKITNVDYWNGDVQAAVQPGGNRIVFISPGGNDFKNMALNLLSLPDGAVKKITDLTSAQSEAASSTGPGDPGFEALRAVGERLSYSWSPDGTRLAFAGVMDGPSADIYIYDATSGTVDRVSQDEAQDFSPSWSPDGNHLLYPAAEGFGTGAGMVMSGVWSADGQGKNAALLYPSKSSGEEIVGWLDNTTVVLDTWTPVCGSSLLRLYDMVARRQVILNQNCFIAAEAKSSPGEVLFANSKGLYILTADNRKPVSVGHDPVTRIDPWSAYKDLFIVRLEKGGLSTFGGSYGAGDMDQQISPLIAPSDSLDVAEYGAIWGWTSMDDGQPGVWVTIPGTDMGQIFTGKARLPIWDLQNNLLFFSPKDGGGYDIYLATSNASYKDSAMVASIDEEVQAVAWAGAH